MRASCLPGLALLAAVAWPASATAQESGSYSLSGTVGGALAVRMRLDVEDGRVSGNYQYEKYGRDLRLEGTVGPDLEVSLREFDPDGKHTGVFRGRFVDGSRFEGTWAEPDGSRPLAFVLSGSVPRAQPPTPTPEPVPGLVERGVLKTPAQEDEFRRLVGGAYPRFLDAMQQLEPLHDLDEFDATAVSGSDTASSTPLAAVVLATDQSKLWAALLDGQTLRYFSNDPEWLRQVPLTIEQWRERFPEAQLVHASAP